MKLSYTSSKGFAWPYFFLFLTCLNLLKFKYFLFLFVKNCIWLYLVPLEANESCPFLQAKITANLGQSWRWIMLIQCKMSTRHNTMQEHSNICCKQKLPRNTVFWLLLQPNTSIRHGNHLQNIDTTSYYINDDETHKKIEYSIHICHKIEV